MNGPILGSRHGTEICFNENEIKEVVFDLNDFHRILHLAQLLLKIYK